MSPEVALQTDDSALSPESRNASADGDPGRTPVAALKVVCSWCSTVLQHGVEPVSHGICIPCKDRQSLVVIDRSLKRARTELLTLQASILTLIPYFKRYCDRGWPSLEEHERSEATDALEALRKAVGDLQ